MQCCGQCAGIAREFNARMVSRELTQYHRRGAQGTTRMLISALQSADVRGLTLLDVGGGVGAIQHELVRAGVTRVTSVDAAPAYLDAQRSEATRLGYGDRASYFSGDFVALAPGVPESDIVTLDRVICCYHDMASLVGLSVARARRFYGIVYPRGTWWNAVGIALLNAGMWIRRSPFRSFLHPPTQVEALIRSHGFRPQLVRDTFIWRIAVYAR